MEKVFAAISKTIQNQNNFYVFATDIQARAWSEYILKTGIVEAISTDRFIAWDTFKARCIRSQHQDKNSIPTLLRKFFAHNIIQKNKEQQLFTSIINPQYIHTSASFADWIAQIVSQLCLWHEKIATVHTLDDEDTDLLLIKNEYEAFLQDNNLFDPSWEKPPFQTDGNTYYIMYPEIIQDFTEYKEILESADCIELVHIDSPTEDLEVLQYTNARSELKETALFIRWLCTPISEGGKGLLYSDIALTVKDVKSYEPYLLQEFSLYNIPIRLRSGKALGEYSGGKLFSLIQDCYTEKFSFNAIKNLILDPAFPWKNKEGLNQLIEFGIKNNCLCTYDNTDIWEKAFRRSPKEEHARLVYSDLKRCIKALAKSTDFRYVLEHYNQFRSIFFDRNMVDGETDAVLGRCIIELQTVVDLEKSYPSAVRCESPLSFFIDYLNSKEYVLQTPTNGVNIFTYKVACSAPFKQHIILDASQNSLTVANQALSFLRDDKRKLLGANDENTSNFFAVLYNNHSSEKVRFSFSQNSFSGFSIPFNLLQPKKVFTQTELNDENTNTYNDYYIKEKKAFLHTEEILDTIHSVQHTGFFNWCNSSVEEGAEFKDIFLLDLKERIHAKVFKNSKAIVSATTLKSFYECPVKWLFSKVLKLEDYTVETNLLDDIYIGTFYHEVLKRVLTQFKDEHKPLAIGENKKISADTEELIVHTTKNVIKSFPESCNIKMLSDLTVDIFKSQEEKYIEKMLLFFTEFSLYFHGSYVSDVEKEIHLEREQYTIVGTIDCVLDFPGNATTEAGKFIVDFKTSSLPSRSICIKQAGQELKDFQLPLYIYLYENEYFQGKEAVQGCSFLSISGKKVQPLIGELKPEGREINPKFKKDRLKRTGENSEGFSFEPTMVATLKAVEDFVNAVCDAQLTLFTDSSKWAHFYDGSAVNYDTCLKCQYKKICRTSYTVSGVPH